MAGFEIFINSQHGSRSLIEAFEKPGGGSEALKFSGFKAVITHEVGMAINY